MAPVIGSSKTKPDLKPTNKKRIKPVAAPAKT